MNELQSVQSGDRKRPPGCYNKVTNQKNLSIYKPEKDGEGDLQNTAPASGTYRLNVT